jgi:hypothetical protein
MTVQILKVKKGSEADIVQRLNRVVMQIADKIRRRNNGQIYVQRFKQREGSEGVVGDENDAIIIKAPMH